MTEFIVKRTSKPTERHRARALSARWLILAGLVSLGACAPHGAQIPPSGIAAPKNADVVPARAPKTTGLQTAASAQQQQLIAKFGGRYDWPPAERYLNSILKRLAAASAKPSQVYRVTLLDSPIVNAFALPSGDLYATRGLLALANDSSEVAAVMAHEIAHVTSHHAAKREELKRDDVLFQRVAAHFEGPQKAAEVKARSQLAFASFSRQQEFQADRIGVRTIAEAGYDPYGAARFLDALERSAALKASLLGQRAGDEQPDLLSMHPTTPERIARAVAQARQFGAPGLGKRGRSAYLASIDGMMFGDDPADGMVLGRRFVHPTLGFSFTAPRGFVLDNYSSAVLGVAQNGAEVLRLDKVNAPADEALDAYVTKVWMAGQTLAQTRSTTINGLPAVTADASGEGWTYRLAAIRLKAAVYRIIFATRTMAPQIESKFARSIASFSPLTAQQADAVRPLRLRVVRAAKGDTAASLAARMALTDRALDFFLLLNGMKADAQVQPGRTYKIVTY